MGQGTRLGKVKDMQDLINKLRWQLIEIDAAARMFAELDRWSVRLTWIAVAAAVVLILIPMLVKVVK